MRRNWLSIVVVLLLAALSAKAQFDYVTNSVGIVLTGYSGGGGAVVISNFVTSIGYAAFERLASQTSITIPGNVTNIGGEAFWFASGLTSVTMSNGVIALGQDAFGDCGNLTNVTIPESLTSIGDYAFESCTSLTNVELPEGLTTLGEGAFYFCTSLTNITIPDTVTSIERIAFAECVCLTNVTIPAGVTNIGDTPFGSCTNLAAILVDPQNSYFTSSNGVLFDKTQTSILEYPGGINGSYLLPSSVTSIAGFAFAYCTGLTNITISAGVTNIGYQSFEGCSNLVSVPIPNSVTEIEEGAFAYCTGLTNMTIPGNVTNIGEYAFDGCPSLASVYFLGNNPAVDSTVFDSDNIVNVYYLPGTIGWDGFYANTGLTPILWNPSIQTGDGSFGVQNDQFGFNITGTNNFIVVVEACTNLASPLWIPKTTNTLVNGAYHFSEPFQPGAPARFYGLGLP